IGGTRIVKAFCMEKQEEKRFAGQIQHLFDTLMTETRYRCLSHPMIELLGGVGISLIIWFGGMQVLKGTSTMGAFMSFLTALIMLYEPVKGVSKINSTIQSGLAAATRIFYLLDIKPEIEEKSDAVVLPPFHECIEFKNVTFSYESGEPVLHGINLKVRRGEILAVVGPSGGGKTTLANLLPRFHDVDSGALLIDDHDIRDVTLYQQTILFNDTVRNNIGYGSRDCSEEDIRRAADAAFAYEFIEELPDGFDTVIGESGARLSGGQRQRVSIARAILKDAPLLVLDEATSALDTESERKVQKALENLMKNRTTIVIAHRLSTIKNADRIIVMQDGRLVEEGTHEHLLQQYGVYEGLHKMQYAE
ncbi:MAG: ATP-binding cassette domain-containing protein, partial [Deltaproteobacteria bacterium]|nr:ATP-binding cassette domain-containing protein [Deltaproteobacteria bacterium]